MRTSTLFKTPQEGAPKERLGAELPGHFTTPTRPFLVDSPIRSRAPAQGDNNMDELNISFGNLSVSGGEGVAQASASARQTRSGERSQRPNVGSTGGSTTHRVWSTHTSTTYVFRRLCSPVGSVISSRLIFFKSQNLSIF